MTGMLLAAAAQVNGAACAPPPCAPAICAPAPCCEPVCSTSCCDEQDCQLYVVGELLYWRPELCGLEGAFGTTIIDTTVAGGITTTTVIESDKEPSSKWSPGFRVGLGASLNCLDVEAAWTHYEGKASFNEDGQYGRWKIKYDTIDLNLGRRFDLSSCFYFTPFIGVRGVKIHQTLHSHLVALYTIPAGSSVVNMDNEDSEKFWGVGPQIGFEADWKIGCNFSLFGSFSAVSYYGRVKGHNFDTDTFTSAVNICNGTKKHCFNNIGTDIALGVLWNRSFCWSCYEVSLMARLGVEQHRIYDFSELGSDGTLSLDGGFFGLGIGFNY